jgi:hypothetical protein
VDFGLTRDEGLLFVLQAIEFCDLVEDFLSQGVNIVAHNLTNLSICGIIFVMREAPVRPHGEGLRS